MEQHTSVSKTFQGGSTWTAQSLAITRVLHTCAHACACVPMCMRACMWAGTLACMRSEVAQTLCVCMWDQEAWEGPGRRCTSAGWRGAQFSALCALLTFGGGQHFQVLQHEHAGRKA